MDPITQLHWVVIAVILTVSFLVFPETFIVFLTQIIVVSALVVTWTHDWRLPTNVTFHTMVHDFLIKRGGTAAKRCVVVIPQQQFHVEVLQCCL